MLSASAPNCATLLRVKLNLDQLEALCRIVELGSFTRAAERLGIAQATVSERIANLERMVGAPVLDRLGRRAEPTAVGRHLAERGQALLDAQHALGAEVEAMVGGGGVVRVGASSIPGEHILPDLLSRLEGTPRPRVHVQIGDTTSIVAAVTRGEVELAVVGAREAGPYLRYQALWRDHLVLAVPSGHPLAGRSVVTIAALGGEPWVVRELGSGTWRTVREALQGVLPAIQPAAVLTSSAAIKAAVIAGLGVSIVSERAVRLEALAGLLATAHVDGLALERWFYLVTDERRTLAPAAQRLVAHLVAHADPAEP